MRILVLFGHLPPSTFHHICSAILNKSNINLLTGTHSDTGFGGHHLPKIQWNKLFLRRLVLVVTQPKSMQRLLFKIRSNLIITTTQEEAVYLILDRLLSMSVHFTDLMSTERSCHITKHALGLIPILNTLAESREERVFNMFNHLSNWPIFQLNSSVDFSPHN